MTKRRVITEREVRECRARGGTRLEIPPDALVTPLARDTAAELRVRLVTAPAGTTSPTPSASPATPGGKSAAGMIVALGSDHGGFELKAQIKSLLQDLGHGVEDVGTNSGEPCDYPDFAYAVARLVAEGAAGAGIMIDGAGIGSCIVANKVPGIRAACCTHEVMARTAREHNDANVLTLGSRIVGLEVGRAVVRAFLETPFAGGRHEARVQKIRDVDTRFRKK